MPVSIEVGVIEKFPQRFGKYLLLEKISTGGMAEVFRVKAFGVEGFQKTFALKRILPHISEDPEFITMFIDEAKIASRLHHGNICQIYEFGRVGDFYFQLMEYIAGFDLRTLNEKLQATKQKLPLSFLLHVVARACEGMDYAHRKTDSQGVSLGIIHRDISPQNVMISFEGTTKLIDFGIAKAKSRASQTQAGVIKGKFAYMPPELLRGETIDGRADVFSLGIVLHELLTGVGLFDRETDLDTLRAVMAAEVPLPSSVDPSIPDFVDRVVLKALTALPADRYPTAEDFQEDLERCVMMTGHPMSSNKVRKFMAEQFPIEMQTEQDKAMRFAAFSETGEVALQTGQPRQVLPKTVETFSGRRLKQKQVKVRGGGGFPEEVTIVHGSHETGESDYEEDDLHAAAQPDSAQQWQASEGYDDAGDPDDLEEVEGILLDDDADELDFMDEPTSVRMQAAKQAGGAPVMEVDMAELASPLLTDADLAGGGFLDGNDLLEDAEILDGNDLLEDAEILDGNDLLEDAEILDGNDLLEDAEILDGNDLLEDAEILDSDDLLEEGGDAPGYEQALRSGTPSPAPAPAALEPAHQPAHQAVNDQQYAEAENDQQYAEGEYAEGEYAEGEYAEGEYAEGEYAEGEYAEGEYAEGEYAEGEHAEAKNDQQYAEGESAEGEYAEGEYAEGEYAEGEYAEGEYAEGEYAEGEYAEGEYTEGEYAEGEYAEGEYAEGEYAEGEYAEGEYAEGENAKGEYVEGEYAEGENAKGEYVEGEYAEGEYAEGEYAEGEYAEGEYAEGEYAEGEYAEGEYAEGEYAEGEYAEGEYAEGEYEDEDEQPTGPQAGGQYAAPAPPAEHPPAAGHPPAYAPAPYAEKTNDGYNDSPYADDEGVFEAAPPAQVAPQAYESRPEVAPVAYAAPASPPPPPAPPVPPAPQPLAEENVFDDDPVHDSEDATMFDQDAADDIRAKFAAMLATEKNKNSDD